jgi:uncharacterized protein YbjT (DUF2867 family)
MKLLKQQWSLAPIVKQRPRLLTFKEAVEEIAKTTGKPIQYQQMSMSVYAVALFEYQLPEDII